MSHFRLPPRRVTAPLTLPRVVAMLVIALGVLSFGAVGTAASTSLVINEVDYDQAGTDASEFLELKNVSGAAINLDAYRVELVNGSGGAVYLTAELPNLELAAGDYYVVCANATTTANCDQDITPEENLIQNGAPDGLRLMLGATTVDALSYEGDTAGATEGTGAGLVDTAAGDESISRCPDGADSDVNNIDFSLRAVTPGAANACAAPKVVVNEVDYDQVGGDGAEYLELKNTSAGSVNLDPYVVELVNGAGGVVYGTFELPAVTLAGGDYYVICANAATVANCDLDVDPNTDRIQNGSPDGIRLLLAGATVDALSYEGDTAGSTEGTGTTAADSNTEAGIGLSRCADGADSDVNNIDFSLRAVTPGAANACAAPKVVVNEVDYDQVGGDGAEYLELKNTSAGSVNLDPYVVELVNGAGGVVYGTFELPAVTLAGGDYYVICANAATVANVTSTSIRIPTGSRTGRLTGSGSCSRVRRSTRSATRATRPARPRGGHDSRPTRTLRPGSACPAAPTAPTPTTTTPTSQSSRSHRGQQTRVSPRRPTRSATAARRRRGSTLSRAVARRRHSPTRRSRSKASSPTTCRCRPVRRLLRAGGSG